MALRLVITGVKRKSSMSYYKILVPLDGSKLAEQALQHAVRIATPQAHIHVISVLAEDSTSEVVSLTSAMSDRLPLSNDQWPHTKRPGSPREMNARVKYLQEVSEWLEPAGYEVTTETLQGPISEMILSVARRGFEVIVMASHHRTGIAKTVLGSVAEAVLSEAPCPVMILPANPS
jgi:nucleotide-binding universal stress UspA family protein